MKTIQIGLSSKQHITPQCDGSPCAEHVLQDHRTAVGQRCHNLTKKLQLRWIFLIIENHFSLSI